MTKMGCYTARWGLSSRLRLWPGSLFNLNKLESSVMFCQLSKTFLPQSATAAPPSWSVGCGDGGLSAWLDVDTSERECPIRAGLPLCC